MKMYFILTKILLKTGMTQSVNQKKRKFQIKSKLLYIFIFICFLPMMFALFMAGKEGYEFLSLMGQEGLVISIVCAISGIMTLVFGISVVISVFYYSNDLEYLLPLPLKPYQIVASKFTITLLFEYITMFVLFFPVLLGYGWAAGSGFDYWIFVVVAFLFLPIVPLIYGGIISMLIMMFSRKAKNRDLVTVVVSAFILVVVLGINAFSSSFSGMSQGEIMEFLAKGSNSLALVTNKLFPHFLLIQKALIKGSVSSGILFVFVVLVGILLFLWIAQFLYFRGADGISQSGSKRKVLSLSQMEKLSRKKNKTYAYTIKELKLVFRSPMYFMNAAMLPLIWPILFMIPLAGQLLRGSESGGLGETLSNIRNSVEGNTDFTVGIIFLVIFAISTLITGMNFTSGTSISREGKNFFIMKFIPISYSRQIFAKVLSGTIISILGTSIYFLFALFVIRASLWIIVVSLVINVLTCFLFNYIQIVVDLIHPKLNWENEQAALKQNFNTMIELVIIVLLAGAIAALAVVLFVFLNIPAYILGLSGCLLLLVFSIVSGKAISYFGAKRLHSLE